MTNIEIKETKKPFREWSEYFQDLIKKTLVYKLKWKSSKAEALETMLTLGNPPVTIGAIEDKIQYVRIEKEGSEVFEVLLKNYL